MRDFTILFDLDGTLIDSTKSILNGFFTAFKRHNLPQPTKNQIAALVGYPLDVMFSRLGVPDDKIDAFILTYKQTYKSTYLSDTTLLDGVKDALKLAHSFADLAVVTTKTSIYSKILLENLGVSEYFSVVVGRDDVKNPKPHPEPILTALSALNKPTKNAFMIGDTSMDAMAAKAANIVSIGVSCGYESKDSLEKICNKVFANAFEVMQFIKNSIKN